MNETVNVDGTDRKIADLTDDEVDGVLNAMFGDEDFVVLLFAVEQEEQEEDRAYLGRLAEACPRELGVPLMVDTEQGE